MKRKNMGFMERIDTEIKRRINELTKKMETEAIKECLKEKDVTDVIKLKIPSEPVCKHKGTEWNGYVQEYRCVYCGKWLGNHDGIK